MKQVEFYFTLDKTFKPGTNMAEVRDLRKKYKSIERFLQPDPTSIYLGCTVSGTYLKVNTGLKIPPVEWDFKSQKVIRKTPNSMEMNSILQDMKLSMEKKYLNLRVTQQEVSAESIKRLILETLQKKVNPQMKATFWSIFSDFLEERKRLSKSSTISKYNNLKKSLSEFEKAHYPLSFEKMTMAFYTEFKIFSIEEKKHLNNTIGKNLKCLKAFLKWAEEHHNQYNTRSDYKRWKIDSDEPEVIYLEQNELEWLEKYPTDVPGLILSKELFIFQCYTGQRHSDILTLKVGDIRNYHDSEDYEWVVNQIKGNKKGALYIPLLAPAKKIFLKYAAGKSEHDRLFPNQCNQLLNKNIKKIGKDVGIERPTTKVNYSGSKRVEKSHPKYMFLSSHVARKTFVTLSLQKGMRPDSIKAITGHTNLTVMQRYMGSSRENRSREMKDKWE